MTATPITREQAARLMKFASGAAVAAAFVMIGMKFYAYLATGSVSLLSTLFDSALDVAASFVNLLAVRHALMPADAEHRFGHGKAEPLAGLMQVAFILGSSLLLLLEVYDHFMHPKPVTSPGLGIAIMLGSIAITGGLILLQRHAVRQTGSVAIKADSAHYASDFLVNISVIAALLISAQFGLWWTDPLFGLCVAVYIAWTAISIGRQSYDMLMDREMDNDERRRIMEIVRAHPEAVNLHDLRTRIAGQDRFIQFHLELPDTISLIEAHRISDAVEAKLQAAFPGAEIIIHQDPHSVVTRRQDIKARMDQTHIDSKILSRVELLDEDEKQG
ncbi:cation diffusion facilitator family transporter [Dongia rigui]|uniref:Cation diffusion facilitator family transporter n=1 Tax=Dongia rigui TaxID=940149 RepID=A0ABU5DX62_9PROT|nr:cation diffusion facilitator family transporter [Dongia rigui]MDY0871505.1 cation diffusion facilitator family transporter [Dongia rigui]